MKSIADKITDTIKTEEKKNSTNKKFKEFEQLLENIDKLGYAKKPDYSFPLVDTIGKSTYTILNKHSI